MGKIDEYIKAGVLKTSMGILVCDLLDGKAGESKNVCGYEWNHEDGVRIMCEMFGLKVKNGVLCGIKREYKGSDGLVVDRSIVRNLDEMVSVYIEVEGDMEDCGSVSRMERVRVERSVERCIELICILCTMGIYPVGFDMSVRYDDVRMSFDGRKWDVYSGCDLVCFVVDILGEFLCYDNDGEMRCSEPDGDIDSREFADWYDCGGGLHCFRDVNNGFKCRICGLIEDDDYSVGSEQGSALSELDNVSMADSEGSEADSEGSDEDVNFDDYYGSMVESEEEKDGEKNGRRENDMYIRGEKVYNVPWRLEMCLGGCFRGCLDGETHRAFRRVIEMLSCEHSLIKYERVERQKLLGVLYLMKELGMMGD